MLPFSFFHLRCLRAQNLVTMDYLEINYNFVRAERKVKRKKNTGLSSFSIIHHHSYNLVQVIFLYTNKFTKYQAFDAYYAH